MKIEKIINEKHDLLSEGDLVLAKYILNHKHIIYDMSINELAEKSLSSKSSVLRFSQKLGFSGYSELKNFMKWDDVFSESPVKGGDIGDIILHNIDKTVKYLSKLDLSVICKAIDKSDNVYLMGTGFLQQNLAAEMQRMFLGMGKNMQIIPMDVRTELCQLVTEKMTAKDMVVVFSRSGNNPALKETLNIPLIKKVKLFAITASYNNWLSAHASFFIPIYSDQHSDSMSNGFYSSTAFHSIIEILAYSFFEYKNKSLLSK